jgi:hypothetical protein
MNSELFHHDRSLVDHVDQQKSGPIHFPGPKVVRGGEHRQLRRFPSIYLYVRQCAWVLPRVAVDQHPVKFDNAIELGPLTAHEQAHSAAPRLVW